MTPVASLFGFLSHIEWQAIVISARVAIFCVSITLVPGIIIGWLLARRQFPGKTWLQTIVQLPLVMPPILVGYGLLVLMGREGLIGEFLYSTLGIRIAFTWWAAVLASVVVGFPLMVRSIQLSIENIDPKLEQAARTSGASSLLTWLTITLPLAWPGLLVGLMLSFVRSLGEFGATIAFAGNIEGQTQTIPLALYTAMQTPGQETAVVRLAMISAIMSLAAVGFSEWLNRNNRRRVHSTSL